MKRTIERANAKINLFLDILSRREDGYHELDTIMQSVELCDVVGIDYEIADYTQITLGCSIKGIPLDERNTAFQAAQKFMDAANLKGKIVIAIDKNIPVGSGLGGGSADAAAVLRGLNRIAQGVLSTKSLFKIAGDIGADVPACLMGGAVRAGGVGEVLTNVSPLKSCYLVIAMTGKGVSTKWAYEKYDESPIRHDGVLAKRGNYMSDALDSGNLNSIAGGIYNCFEEVILPERTGTRKLLTELRESAVCAGMSGSGAAVFGIYKDLRSARKAAGQLSRRHWFAFVNVSAPIC